MRDKNPGSRPKSLAKICSMHEPLPRYKLNRVVVAAHSSSKHANMKSDDSFVTLQDVFQPQKADSNLARATNEQQEIENKWGAVWAEASLVPSIVVIDDAVPVHEHGVATAVLEQDAVGPATAEDPTPYRRGGCLAIVIGLTFTLVSILSTAATELAAIVVYLLAAAFYQAAETCKCGDGKNSLTPLLLFYAIFQLVVAMLMVVDAVLLALSIFVAELLGFLCWVSATIFGCSLSTGLYWHQYIRKLNHFMRWAFRSFHQGWKPERGLYNNFQSNEEPSSASARV